jgi:hypothetical protein
LLQGEFSTLSVCLLVRRGGPDDSQVVPESTPRAPPPPIAIALSPLFFAVTAPALFDSYSVGVLLLQLLVPELRTFQGLRAFRRELEVRHHEPPIQSPS